MGVYISLTPKLPSTYQEVEYIQSSGTQHIDTLHQHTANTKFEIKFNYQTQSWTWNMICGSRSSYNTSDCMNLYLHNSNYIAYGVWWKYSDNFYSSSIDTDYVISLSKTNITINWSSTSLSTSLTNYSYNDWIFWVNTNNSQVEQKVKMKLYYFKIYEWTTLVRDFVPCYRKSDNVIWLYDLVNNQFYTNSWSGTFSKGGNVCAMPLREAYLGNATQIYEYWFYYSDWTMQDGTSSNFSNWIVQSTGSWNWFIWSTTATTPINNSTIKKLTIEWEIYYYKKNWNYAITIGMLEWINTWEFVGIVIPTQTSSGYTTEWLKIGSNNLVSLSSGSFTNYTTYTIKWEFDFVNKTVKFYRNWSQFGSTGTISDAILTTFRGWSIKHVYINWWDYSKINWAKITAEY